MDPKERLKQLTLMVPPKVSRTQKIDMYYLSGQQMYSFAKQCYQTRNYEKAYILYLRYISLFLEDIRKHPDFSKVPQRYKIEVNKNISEMMPEAEKIKELLLAQYEVEYKNYLENKKKSEEEKKQPFEQKEMDILLPEIPDVSLPNRDWGGLQNITIPYTLIPKFLDLAKENTKNNIETCALLTGVLNKDYLTITTLLVSQQSGTSDECTAENDVATFNAMETNGLLTFGWIHTHPSQDAFLSSVDLHTHYGYQSMLPEAIAIVCAPKYSNQVFQLTDLGLDQIGGCDQRGFHVHSGSPLFQTASHVTFVEQPCKVIDLRN